MTARPQTTDRSRPAAAAVRPNIVFIYTDDQRYDALSIIQEAQGAKARFPWFSTPNIDRIGREGICFRNAFVVNSLCSPSRATMLTGRYNHINGMTNNHSELADTTDTYATILTKAGYATAFIGKWHMGRQRARPGFTYSFSFIGQGKYVDCAYQLNGKEMVQTRGWVDDISTDTAMAFITRHQHHPFLVTLAFKSSHYNWTSPARTAHLFKDITFKRPANETAEVPYEGQIDDGRTTPPPVPAINSWTVNHDTIIRSYFRVLKAIDDNVGRILHLLDSLNLTNNTIVVFTSDNGYFLGEHNLSDKRDALEESIRVPLLMRYPAKVAKGQMINKMVLNADLAPTFVDFAGATPTKRFQGRSWAPLAEGKPIKWRTSFFYEYFYETPYAIPTIIAERTETAKMIRYPGERGWSELYDLKKDPGETRNLYNDPKAAGLKAQLQRAWIRDSTAVNFFIPDSADKRPLDKDGHYRRPLYKISSLKKDPVKN